MFKKDIKRERSVNFSREEVDLLINLVEANIHVLENKKSDAATWQEKESCWKSIEATFNSLSGHTFRSVKNLKIKYEGLKRDTRKKSACIRAETYRNGGEPTTAVPLTPIELKVKEMILLSVDGMKSDFDSDRALTDESTQPETINYDDTVNDNTNHLFVDIKTENIDKSTQPETINYDDTVNDNTNHLFVDIKTENIDRIEQIELDTTFEDPTAADPLEKSASVPLTPILCRKQPIPSTTKNVDDDHSEVDHKWAQWKPTSLRSKKHHALCKPKPKRPFEKLAEAKVEIAELRKKILEEEFKHKIQEMEEQRKRWKFEEEDRQRRQKFEEEERDHKRKMWALERKYYDT